jgi:hypothetical protein
MKPHNQQSLVLLVLSLCTLLTLVSCEGVAPAKLADGSGISPAEASELTQRGQQILNLIWSDKAEAAYACTARQYRKQVNQQDFSKAIHAMDLKISGRTLVDMFTLKDAQASGGDRTIHLLYHTQVTGEAKPANEHLFLIHEGGRWMMTGHWIAPGT